MGAPTRRTKQRNPPTRKPKGKTPLLDLISLDNNISFIFVLAILILGILVFVMVIERSTINTILTALLSSFTAFAGYIKGKSDKKN